MKYDTIIVGAGSSGAILASRLSENPDHSVLLVEAGPDYPDFQQIPDDIKYGYGKQEKNDPWKRPSTDHRWNFIVRYTDESLPGIIPRGKVVGGSSAVNAQIFLRGVPEDYDMWAEWGNDRWSYQQLLPYFRMIETDTDFSGDFHGPDGPIIVRRFKSSDWNEDQLAFYESALDRGFPDCPDHNAPDTTGVGPTPLNNPGGVRWSTAIGYLNRVRDRSNLTIKAECLVRKVLFSGKRAIGIEARIEGEILNIEGKQIILSAGAIGSPHLLLLSGIGPSGHLNDLEIPVIHELPGVGENLRDHPQVQVSWRTRDDFYQEVGKPGIQVALRYTASGSQLSNDMLIHPGSRGSVGRRSINSHGHGFTDEKGLLMVVALYLEVGSGFLRLRDSDPHIQPLLNYNFLEDEFDRSRMREGVHTCIELARSQGWSRLVKERLEPTDEDLASDDTLDDWLKRNVQTSHHVSGTCKMGPCSDDMSVVSQFGKVYGVQNLRVVDASIMPDCIRANTNATSLAIGERVAAFIREGL